VNWTIEFADNALARVAVWERRFPGITALIQQRLTAVSEDPLPHLGPPAVPTTTRPFYLLLGPAEGLPRTVYVTFYFDTHPDERRLACVSCQHTTMPDDGEEQTPA
jgi:hypothetical protein